jgi:hypothetical protein
MTLGKKTTALLLISSSIVMAGGLLMVAPFPERSVVFLPEPTPFGFPPSASSWQYVSELSPPSLKKIPPPTRFPLQVKAPSSLAHPEIKSSSEMWLSDGMVMRVSVLESTVEKKEVLVVEWFDSQTGALHSVSFENSKIKLFPTNGEDIWSLYERIKTPEIDSMIYSSVDASSLIISSPDFSDHTIELLLHFQSQLGYLSRVELVPWVTQE